MCVSETKLSKGHELHVDGYKWLGHNRQNLHRNAKHGSGGVGVLICDSLWNHFTFEILDKSYEGILWIQFISNVDNFVFNLCVCYLPPEGSTRNIDVNDFYETLLAQVYLYQNDGLFSICGDFNSRISNMTDYIEGVDDVPDREVIDFTHNMYGYKMIDFLLGSNCCVLNGRQDVCIQDDFTSVSTKGLSVVDYCMVPYEALPLYNDFKVYRSRQLFEDAGCVGYVDPTHILPDHSLLCWDVTFPFHVDSEDNMNDENDNMKISFTKHSRNTPDNFLMDNETIDLIDEQIRIIETQEMTQESMDEIYDEFCVIVKSEMDTKLDKTVITINSSSSSYKKKRRVKKPWWSEELTLLWDKLAEAERKWNRSSGAEKRRRYGEMKDAKRVFDREVQGAKRRFWRQNQEELMQLNATNPREFWKKIGKIGVASERKTGIPWEIVQDGEICKDKEAVLGKWKNDFSDLLNYNTDQQSDQNINSGDINNGASVPHSDTGLETQISYLEVKKAIANAKQGKAVGCDNIPVEILNNDTACKYLHQLFYKCYETGIIPSLWMRGIIHPIPKDSTLDARDPMNYRGITLACSTYKLYCHILNNRLVEFSERNKLICDEQNGFRPERGCLDQLSTLTNVIETRKQMKKSTFALFVDFSKAFDRIDRQYLWNKLVNIGIPNKMLTALQSIYRNVQCCVNINGAKTDYFNVSSGLKQGCLLSPVLFNMFTNDLVMELKQSGCGLNIGVRELLCVLCYADDLVCVAENEEDIQKMLNIIKSWCDKWSMAVNTKKTQIVHFRPGSISRTNHVFEYGEDTISVVEKYKYLGLVLNEYLDYDFTASVVAKSAGRALGLLIAKFKAYGGMHYDCFTKLYHSLVQPVIDYGAAIWGTKSYSCINAVQHRACRFYMGVGKYTPNTAVIGDMGWTLPGQKQWICITRLWCRFNNMDNDRINKKVFMWAASKSGNSVKNWIYKVKQFYTKHSMDYIANSEEDLSYRSVKNQITPVLTEMYASEWQSNLNRVEAIRGQGHNKLRTYRKFKDIIKTEEYLKQVINFKHRSALAKFRCGVAPIRIETGRYEQLDLAERLCPLCDLNEIESEEHVLIRCSAYTTMRNDLFNVINNICHDFNNFCDTDKLCFILSNPDTCKISAKACYDILCHRRLLLYAT